MLRDEAIQLWARIGRVRVVPLLSKTFASKPAERCVKAAVAGHPVGSVSSRRRLCLCLCDTVVHERRTLGTQPSTISDMLRRSLYYDGVLLVGLIRLFGLAVDGGPRRAFSPKMAKLRAAVANTLLSQHPPLTPVW